jgi:hypothetical protein
MWYIHAPLLDSAGLIVLEECVYNGWFLLYQNSTAAMFYVPSLEFTGSDESIGGFCVFCLRCAGRFLCCQHQ